ncbi:hypothetical protein RZS28_08660 [Methylocapsa polymorpha]|uniref:Uncharacterized protein n=1 Tax=Methylocapsa polymorpha TaxID=3080828 RepID=A0ABZ0HX01_9HYPH|nr:hypothetical protein RZS28_08660 [Methylocapsa sp. RX1]
MCALLPRADIDALLGSENPRQAFATIEERLSDVLPAERPPLREQVIEALDAAFKSGKLFTNDWLRAICEASRVYLRLNDETQARLFEPSCEERLCALLMDAFEPSAPSERGALVSSVICDLSDISLLCALFRRVEHAATAEGAEGSAADSYFGLSSKELRSELLGRVMNLASSRRLWTQASPSAVLWFWFTHGQEQEVYIFIKQSMRDASSLAPLLELALERSDAVEGGHEVVAVRRWSKIIDFNTLEKCALDLLLSGASKVDKTRARRFLDAFADGKSDLFK